MTNTRGMLAASAESEPAKAPQALRIVVADDDRDCALTLMMLLREEGHDVKAVHAGRSVMGAIIDFDPDVVILDIHLPDMSGWQIASAIRTRRGKQPLLVGISGQYTKAPDKMLAQLNGFDHYFVKPCPPEGLLKALEPLRR